MHQDATWYGGRPQPKRLCVSWGPSPLLQKGQSPPIFGPRLSSLDGCMDQDDTWYGGRPWPTWHCVWWGPSYPQKKGHTHPHQILVHVYCGQMAGWMKTPLGTEVDLGSGHIVLDGVPAPTKVAQLSSPPVFGACLLWHIRPSQLLPSSCSSNHKLYKDEVCWWQCRRTWSHLSFVRNLVSKMWT